MPAVKLWMIISNRFGISRCRECVSGQDVFELIGEVEDFVNSDFVIMVS